jgi:putative transposase
MNLIYGLWLSKPFYGYRRITEGLRQQGVSINRKRVQRLMREMGIQALARSPKTSKGNKEHKKYPYLLRDVEIDRCNKVWMVDITYLRLGRGFMYLVALIDVHSRYIVGWSLSNTLETDSCLTALNWALEHNGSPEIINSDQGCQFTSEQWVKALNEAKIKISMTGKGRCHDNIYIERFWRSLKHEEIYLNDYDNVAELESGIGQYIEFYNTERPHQALDYKTPAELYFAEKETSMDMCTNLLAVGEQILHTYPQTQQF